MDEVGLTVFEGLGCLVPFLHDKLMGDVQLVQYEVEYLDIIAVGLSVVITELVGREFPVADNNQRVLLGVFTCILCSCRQQDAKAEQTGDGGYDDLSGHDAFSLYSIHFKGFTRNREPYTGALAYVGLDIDGAAEVLDEIVADTQSQACP